MANGGEGPGGQVEGQLQNVETGKPIEYYRGLVENLNEGGKESLSVATLSPILKAIDASDFGDMGDVLKRELFDEIRQAIKDVMEPVKSELLSLANELESDNTNIPEAADEAVVAEFMNHEILESITKNYANIDMSDLLPDGVDDTALKMFFVEQSTEIFSVPEMQRMILEESRTGVDGFKEKLDELEAELGKLQQELFQSFIEGNEPFDVKKYEAKIQLAFDNIVGEGAYDSVKKIQVDVSEKIQNFRANLVFLKTAPGIDFSRITVMDYIGEIKKPLTNENAQTDIDALIKLSGEEYDRDSKLETKVAKINKIFEAEGVSPESVADFSAVIQQSGDSLSKMILDQGNKSPIGELIAKLFREGGALSFIGALFGPEFQEAISESNMNRQKALFNLVKTSNTESAEGFKIDGTDFSTISGSDLKGFFASMDSYGINYTKSDFWEHLMTGKVKDGSEVDGVDTIHKVLKGDNEHVFTIEKDFSNSNEKFLERLNAVPKKADEVEDGVVEGEGEERNDQ